MVRTLSFGCLCLLAACSAKDFVTAGGGKDAGLVTQPSEGGLEDATGTDRDALISVDAPTEARFCLRPRAPGAFVVVCDDFDDRREITPATSALGFTSLLKTGPATAAIKQDAALSNPNSLLVETTALGPPASTAWALFRKFADLKKPTIAFDMQVEKGPTNVSDTGIAFLVVQWGPEGGPAFALTMRQEGTNLVALEAMPTDTGPKVSTKEFPLLETGKWAHISLELASPALGADSGYRISVNDQAGSDILQKFSVLGAPATNEVRVYVGLMEISQQDGAGNAPWKVRYDNVIITR